MEPEVKNERQKYIEKIEKDLNKASKAKFFVESAEGRLALDYIAEYITDFNKQLLKITNTREEDIALKAKLDVLRRLHGVLEVQGSDSAIAKMREQLDLATSEE
jgi:hypothetical protein